MASLLDSHNVNAPKELYSIKIDISVWFEFCYWRDRLQNRQTDRIDTDKLAQEQTHTHTPYIQTHVHTHTHTQIHTHTTTQVINTPSIIRTLALGKM